MAARLAAAQEKFKDAQKKQQDIAAQVSVLPQAVADYAAIMGHEKSGGGIQDALVQS